MPPRHSTVICAIPRPQSLLALLHSAPDEAGSTLPHGFPPADVSLSKVLDAGFFVGGSFGSAPVGDFLELRRQVAVTAVRQCADAKIESAVEFVQRAFP